MNVFPRRFGQHVLIRKLAEGGMAELFLAKQLGAEGFERTVVIKCMLEHFSRSPEFREMFLDEARLAARLVHPNIVQITDLGVAEERYFICMEYLAGEDLETLIHVSGQRGEPIPIPIAVRVILAAAEGLDFAHSYEEGGRHLDLVHRDISPSNIFVTFQGMVKVLDFGIAKAHSRITHTQPGLLKGKLGYMSPEQARGDVLDGRSDVFSLGVSFYELLTGRRVFEKDNEIGVLLALMQQDIPAPSTHRPDIPPALEAILLKALSRDREQRYQSAGELRADLEKFLVSASMMVGTNHLAQYMQRLFGAEWVARKTTIPTLRELEISPPSAAPATEASPGLEKTFVRPSNPDIPAVQGGAQTKASITGEKGFEARPVQGERGAAAVESASAARPRAKGGSIKGALIGVFGTVMVIGLAAGAAVVVFPDRVSELLGRTAPTPPPRVIAPPLGGDATSGGDGQEAGGGTGDDPSAGGGNAAGGNAAGGNGAGGNGAGGNGAGGNDSAAGGNHAGGTGTTSTGGTHVAAAGGNGTTAGGGTHVAAAGTDPANGAGAGTDSSDVSAIKRITEKAVRLTQKDVNAVLGRRAGKLVACGEQFRGELPADKRVKVLIMIDRSGKVAEAKTSHMDASPGLSACLLGEIQALKFPRNVNDPELRIELPLQFTEQT